MTTPITFTATVERTGGTTTGIEVPEHVLTGLGGGKRPAVTVTINGASFSTTLGSMGGRVMIPLSAERRALTGTAGGDRVDVTLALDTAPKEIAVPDDLAAALATNGLRARFDALARRTARSTSVRSRRPRPRRRGHGASTRRSRSSAPPDAQRGGHVIREPRGFGGDAGQAPGPLGRRPLR